MIPMIVRVWCENGTTWSPTHVPVTPQTTYQDLLECCREPGDERCLLFSVHPHHGVHVLKQSELPINVVTALGPDVQFVLKYVDDQTGGTDKCNGMKEPGSAEELVRLNPVVVPSFLKVDGENMFICVRQPPETALLYQGGSPIAMGPLNADGFKNRTSSGTITSDNLINKSNRNKNPKDSLSATSKLFGISGNLLNLRKIERRSKTTKIHVNPLGSDDALSSDDNAKNKTDKMKWIGKKKRHKTGESSTSKISDQDSASNNLENVDGRKSSDDKKISISCFKTRSSSNVSTSDKEYEYGKDNCVNENSTNVRSSSVEPDIVLVSRSSSADNLKSDSELGAAAAALHVISEQPRSSHNVQTIEVLGEGVELTVGELRAMALRQQQQIDTQHQLLCAKEQRLRYLKQQEARQHQVAVEGERLRRLRERVEAQELKLRRLRALRGQLDRNKQTNLALTNDLESIRALFNEKEKELSVAVAKVEELTRQLEDLRPGRAQPTPPSAHELDKLRRELMYRNKLNEQQNGRLSAQRAALGARQEEMRSIDRRVSELQARLLRQRALNRQLAAAQRHQPHSRLMSPTMPSYGPPRGQSGRGNVAAVEPYNHVPYAQSVTQTQQGMKQNMLQNVQLKLLTQSDNISGQMIQQEAHYMQQKPVSFSPGYPPPPPAKHELQHVQQGIGNPYEHKPYLDHVKYQDYAKQPQSSPNSTSSSNSYQLGKEPKTNDHDILAEFAASKTDPKYQTLPFNTKFPQSSQGKMKIEAMKSVEARGDGGTNGPVGNVGHMTVHSTPLSAVNKSLATPLEQAEAAAAKLDLASKICQEGKENQSFTTNSSSPQTHSNGQVNLNAKKSQNSAIFKNTSMAVGSNSATTNSSISYGKPVSSVAPTSVQVSSGKPSPIYQTSSTKIQPVQPQTVQTQSVATHVLSNTVASQPQMVRSPASSMALSPPQGASTPLDASAAAADKSPKPALPPKPTVKAPPRQSASIDVMSSQMKEEIALTNSENTNVLDIQHHQREKDSTNGSTSSSSGSNDMIIKAKPLTIRKPPISEQPKLRNLSNSKSSVSGNINRRIEMPSAFLFPEINRLSNETKNGSKSNENSKVKDEVDRVLNNNNNITLNSSDKTEEIKEEVASDTLSDDMNDQDSQEAENIMMRCRKGNLKQGGKALLARRVSFDPLALLLDASLEGELELVKKTATQVQNASAANDEGITALHNAICAGHIEIVKFLVELGCDVNAQDSDGWTPLHCAASCNNLPMVRFLVDNGACIFATTLSDHETAAEKCEEDEEGFDGCSEYLYSVQEKLGIMNGGEVYGVFAYSAARADELCFSVGGRLQVLRKGDEHEREWWWCRDQDNQEGYVPRNLLGLYPRVNPQQE